MSPDPSVETSLALVVQSIERIETTLAKMEINGQDQWRHIRVMENESLRQAGAIKAVQVVGACAVAISGIVIGIWKLIL